MTVLLSTINVYFSCKIKKTECKLITLSYLEPLCLSIFLYRFVIDHITCYYFRLMAYSISPVENKNDLELDFKVFFFVDSCR